MATTERVLRVRRSDQEDNNAFVLVKVVAEGSHPLDLRLIGTEGVNPYLVTIKHSSIRKLRASNYPGTEQEWETLLRHALLHERPDPTTTTAGTKADLLDGVETVATVEEGADDGHLTLLIRKNISGITQRLGSIQLAQDDSQEIELFDWAAIAAQAASSAQDDAATLERRFAEQCATATRLNAQLDDLIRAKAEHEDELLHKFTQLLNAKKLKIRNQQRLLSIAKIEPGAVARRDGAKPSHRAKGKRKANGEAAPNGEDSDSDDGFAPAPPAAMDVDSDQDVDVKDEDEEDLDERGPAAETPDRTETEDDDEGGEENDDAELNAAPNGRRGRTAASNPPNTVGESSTLRSSHIDAEDEVAQAPPPRRELPFAKHDLRSKPAEAPRAAPDDEDDETEDDEL